MNKSLPIVLWLLVLVTGSLTLLMLSKKTKPIVQDGRVFVDVPWGYLPAVERFQLTNQNNEAFDSASLDGQVYAVSFFFATCPTICRDLNKQIALLNKQMQKDPIRFVNISVDPEVDTPDVLSKYAAEFDATAGRWDFLTGPFYRIKELGQYNFRVIIDKANHTDDILLIDKWGRYRDRFKWNEPVEMKRFMDVSRKLIQETEPPLGEMIHSRNVLADMKGTDWEQTPKLREFALTDSQGNSFFSRDLIGEVWIASFFFSSCSTICPKQNEFVAGLASRINDARLKFVSITTDPITDTTERLRAYAEKYRADPKRWIFLTGNELLIRRISTDYFEESAGEGHHSSKLMVVDRWGRLRGKFDWQKPEEIATLLELVKKLKTEPIPQTIIENH